MSLSQREPFESLAVAAATSAFAGALNEELDAAGARFFAGGLESASHAKSLRKQPDGMASSA